MDSLTVRFNSFGFRSFDALVLNQESERFKMGIKIARVNVGLLSLQISAFSISTSPQLASSLELI